MKHSLPTRPTPWLRLLVGIGIIIGLVALLGGDAFANGLAVIGPASIAAALAIGLLTTVLGALRWWLVARRVGLQLRVRDAIAEVYRATFLNAVLPSGVLGDVDRAVRHGRDSGDTARSARAVVLERTAGQVVLIGVACIVLPTQPALVAAVLSGPGHPPVAVAIGAVAVLAAATGVAIVVARSRPGSGKWRRVLHDAAADARAGLLARDTWPALFGLSLAALGGFLALFLVAARAAGTTASTLQLLPLLLMALLAMALPVNVGGWGPREGIAALGFWMAGLGAPLGITVSVAYGVLALIAALPGGLVLLARRAARNRAERARLELPGHPDRVAAPAVANPADAARPPAPYPAAPYPAAPYPTAQYPTAQYPTAQYPMAQYPSAPYPARHHSSTGSAPEPYPVAPPSARLP
jgi:uncharacterized membrane protein YbhN (UPF0104 family)